MPELKAFKGICYNTKKINLSSVVAPPYDVITPQQQNELYDESDFNIVRLILGREENRYEASAGAYRQWRKDGILVQDEQPAFYVLTQTIMTNDGKQVTRKGFISLCKLEELGKGSVFPHEKTLAKPKEDRLKLFNATDAIFSQIFSLYNDPTFELNEILYGITSTKASAEVEYENVLNRMWKLTDPKNIATVKEFFKGKNVLIADGHHRYETALAYCQEKKSANPAHTGEELYNYVPMFLTNMHDPGLTIFPTHRILHGLPNFDSSQFIEKLEEYFRITLYSNQNELLKHLPLKNNNIGLVLPTAIGFILLELKSLSSMKELGVPDVLAKLDVSILHTLILKHILGISEEAQLQKLNLHYVKDEQQAVNIVKDKKAQAAFLLNATPIDQVNEAAEAGYVLPQKSTYFYPKLLSGLVLFSFVD